MAKRRTLTRAFASLLLLCGGTGITVLPQGTATIVGSLPTGAAPTTRVTVEMEPTDPDAPVGTILRFDDLTSELVHGRAFSIGIPSSTALRDQLAGGQAADLEVLAQSATGTTTTFTSITSDSGGTAAASMTRPASAQTVDVGTLPTAWSTPSTAAGSAAADLDGNGPGVSPPPPCQTKVLKYDVDETRIGELHVASPATDSGFYSYEDSADSSITVGITTQTDPNYKADGSFKVTVGRATTGKLTEAAGFVRYIEAHFKYEELYDYAGACRFTSQVRAVQWSGDIYPGQNTPPQEPYSGGCLHDPYGYADIVGGYDGSTDFSKAESYSAIATVFGFTFGGETGFTEENSIGYSNPQNGRTSYTCGRGYMPDVPVVYNTD
jgi:hypothetical protein